MPNRTKILVIVVAIVAVFTAWFLLGAKKEQKITENLGNLQPIFKEEKSGETNSVPTAPSASAQTKKYKNGKYGFSFNYPDDFAVSEFPEENGKTILMVQNTKTGQGLQVYITAYDDPNFIVNKERILRDVPDMPFLNSANVVVDGKAKGVAFFSQNESFGDTAEVWFASDGKFFQATTYGKNVRLLEEIVKSWKFR